MDQNAVTLRSAAFLAVRLAVACICSFFTAKMICKYLDPTYSEKKSARRRLTDYELQIASQIVVGDESDVTWNDIGGYDDLLAELKDTVILPLKLRSSSTFLQPPKGVLLYCCTGCGKTLIARAVAKDAGNSASFINLDISSLTDKWYGESEKLAAAVFSLVSLNWFSIEKLKLCRHCRLKKYNQQLFSLMKSVNKNVRLSAQCEKAFFFADAFLRVRESRDHEVTAMMKAQFLSNWDGFASDRNCRVVIIGASNRPLDVDPAILRRMPSRFCLNLPDEKQRAKVLQVLLRDEQLHADVNLEEIAAQCQLFSCSDLSELCRLAAVTRVQEQLRSGANIDELNGQPFRLADFKTALARMKRDDDFNQCIDLNGAFSE
ncbi:hypothetical protein M513_10132 [Trichuris suis]|uniref:AAA+ ATPase domain-containing protein n=1 Tax=Trichuris suis TaxID=68888 RepID=A0A085LVI4_9BILA|nr:hypothetical protein M513_10132 [Trichuris suis]